MEVPRLTEFGTLHRVNSQVELVWGYVFYSCVFFSHEITVATPPSDWVRIKVPSGLACGLLFSRCVGVFDHWYPVQSLLERVAMCLRPRCPTRRELNTPFTAT